MRFVIVRLMVNESSCYGCGRFFQPGDVPDTYADVTDLVDQFGYKPATPVKEGIANFAKWFTEYYGK